MPSSPTRSVAIAVVVVAVAALLAVLLRTTGRTEAPPAGGPGGPTASDAPASGPVAPDGPVVGAERTPPGAPAGAPAAPEDADFDAALRWSAVDLEAVRRELPDNLYWSMSAPTDDPREIERREAERARWNREYGKVLSGTASDAEIRDYFALRRRISEDAIAFAAHLLSRYGDALPERDVGMLELAVRLHGARLEELPRREAEAEARRSEQDRLREAWLADEAAFGAAPPDTAD